MIEPLFLVAILQIITASSVFFVWVVRYENIIEEFEYYKLPTWLRDLVGILKVSFGIMLLMGINDEKFKNILPPLILLYQEKQKELVDRLNDLKFISEKNLAA